jgi:hypothetical protein
MPDNHRPARAIGATHHPVPVRSLLQETACSAGMATGRLPRSGCVLGARCSANPTYRVSRIVRDSAPSFSRCPGGYRPERRRQFTRAPPGQGRSLGRHLHGMPGWAPGPWVSACAACCCPQLQRRGGCTRSMVPLPATGRGEGIWGIPLALAAAMSTGFIFIPDDGDLLRQAPADAFGLSAPEHAQRRVDLVQRLVGGLLAVLPVVALRRGADFTQYPIGNRQAASSPEFRGSNFGHRSRCSGGQNCWGGRPHGINHVPELGCKRPKLEPPTTQPI